MRRASRSSSRLAVSLAVVGLLLAGCVSAPTVEAGTAASPSPSASPSSSPAPTSGATCTPAATVSYAPSTTSSYVTKQIRAKDRGYLLVGVSADTRLLGAVDPKSPDSFQGFDIEIARLIAKAALGDPTKIRFKVISTADRIKQLQTEVNAADNAAGGVDLVARAFTMNCPRWNDIAFSAVYFTAHQGLLVPSGSPIKTVADLAGQKVCAPRGSTSLDNIAKVAPEAETVPVAAHTDCLVLLQRGAVDAVTGDDAILAGFKAQDPATVVLDGIELSNEPYGLGVNKAHQDFAAFVNSALAQAISDGTWQKAYDAWLKPALGAGTPPTPQYGRT